MGSLAGSGEGTGRSLGRTIAGWALSALASPPVVRLMAGPALWLPGRGPRGERIDLTQFARILVLRLDEIGDVTMTSAFLRELRRNVPGARITLVVKPTLRNLVERCPHVNEVLTVDWSAGADLPEWRRRGRAVRWARAHLAPRRFDLAILPRWDADYHQATFLAYASGARWRVGFSETVTAHKRRVNRGYDSLLTHALEDATVKHEVERTLDLIRFVGGTVEEDRLEAWLGPEDDAYAETVFHDHQVGSGEPVVGLAPSGGNSPLKQWPVHHFIELGRRILRACPSRLLVVGGQGEEALGAEIERALAPFTINVVGATTLRQMAALLKRCQVVVGNDAGPMHVAAAMGIPVVALFGASCPHRFGPWGNGHRVLWTPLPCGPCFQTPHVSCCSQCIFDRPHCILGIAVEEVQRAVEEILLKNLERGPCIPAGKKVGHVAQP